MGWTLDSHPAKVENVQRSLFLELTEEEQKVVHTLEKQGNLQINTLVVETDIPVHKMSAILFELEMKEPYGYWQEEFINYYKSNNQPKTI